MESHAFFHSSCSSHLLSDAIFARVATWASFLAHYFRIGSCKSLEANLGCKVIQPSKKNFSFSVQLLNWEYSLDALVHHVPGNSAEHCAGSSWTTFPIRLGEILAHARPRRFCSGVPFYISLCQMKCLSFASTAPVFAYISEQIFSMIAPEQSVRKWTRINQ